LNRHPNAELLYENWSSVPLGIISNRSCLICTSKLQFLFHASNLKYTQQSALLTFNKHCCTYMLDYQENNLKINSKKGGYFPLFVINVYTVLLAFATSGLFHLLSASSLLLDYPWFLLEYY